MTRGTRAGIAGAAALLLFVAYGSRAGQPPMGSAAPATPDVERLQAEVQELRKQVARLTTETEKAAARTAADLKALEAGAINVRTFGAKGDGVTDDTAALQAALDAAGNNSPWGVRGTRILVPPGEYLISATLKVHRMAFEMIGCGVGNSPAYKPSPGLATVFRWNGPANTPMMMIRDSHGIAIRRIRWEGREGVAGTTAINLKWLAEDQQAGNAATVIEQCHFGRAVHTPQGIHKGDLAYGILMDGDNGNNDEFKIDRCYFVGCAKAGIRMANTQSVWGSVNDVTFSECGAGIETASSLTGYNVCFDACGPDFRIASTAHVRVFGWQSERSRKLAELSPDAALFADGGYVQVGAIGGGVMIDAFPTDSAQLILRNMQFTQNTLSPRPKIRFGPSEKDVAVGLNFRVKVLDCTGLFPDQFQLAGRFWAEAPESRGEVEFRGTADRTYHFRNFLRTKLASARTLDTSRVDLAVTDATPVTVNAPGPIGVQGTSARIHAGSGSPENVVEAGAGSLYLRTEGVGGPTLYVKESGAGAAGWKAR
jgi:hypothetical protein